MKKQTAQDGIQSLKNAGYSLAKNKDGVSQVAQFVLLQSPNFDEEKDEKTETELDEGIKLRFYENRGDKYYVRVSDAIVEAKADTEGAIVANVHVAFAMTPQEFGKLRDTDAPWHGVLGKIRESYRKYRSDCMNALVSAIKKIKTGDKPRERKANLNFSEYVTKVFGDLETRAKNAKARSDSTANLDKFREAKAKFLETWNK
jgi:hypothetical protein